LQSYSLKSWDVILDNLCNMGGQDLGGLLNAPESRVVALHEAFKRRRSQKQ